MKKLFIFFVFVLAAVSCGHHYSGSNGEKTQQDAEKEFTETLNHSDSTAMLIGAETFIQRVVSGQTDEAVNMLYVLYGNELYQKSLEYSNELVERFKIFKDFHYTLDYFAFSTQGNNDVCYMLKPSAEDGVPGFRITLNPVLVDGVWYMTLKDGSQTSAAMNPDKQLDPYAPAPESITLHK